MIVLDANILLYAYNSDAPNHERCERWLKEVFSSGEVIGLPTVTIWAFLRITTNARIWTRPKSAADAFGIVREWLDHPSAMPLHPGKRHFEILEELVVDHAVSGPLMTDAVLAAVAIENGAVLASTDQGFSRFAGLKWLNPLRPC